MNRRRRIVSQRGNTRRWGTGNWTTTTTRKRYAGNRDMKNWTQNEINTLKRFYRTNSNNFIAKKLGRSEGSVQYKASSLGLRKSPAYLRQIRNHWA